MNISGSRVLIPFSRSVAMSRITRRFFVTIFDSRLLISIAFCCVFAIAYTFVDYYTSTRTFVNSCYSTLISLFSPVSFCAICASTKCCSTTLSSSDSSMYTKSIDVIHGPIYSLACHYLLFLCKNSITNVLVVFISWIIICTNFIFSLYTFLFAHFEDDDECGDDLTANG